VVNRLKRIEGQVRGGDATWRMVEKTFYRNGVHRDGRPCEDVAHPHQM
jgi:DNA-binding FrmR family transcriptional regulator